MPGTSRQHDVILHVTSMVMGWRTNPGKKRKRLKKKASLTVVSSELDSVMMTQAQPMSPYGYHMMIYPYSFRTGVVLQSRRLVPLSLPELVYFLVRLSS